MAMMGPIFFFFFFETSSVRKPAIAGRFWRSLATGIYKQWLEYESRTLDEPTMGMRGFEPLTFACLARRSYQS